MEDGRIGPRKNSFKPRMDDFKINEIEFVRGLSSPNSLRLIGTQIRNKRDTGLKKVNDWSPESITSQNFTKNGISVPLSPGNLNFHYTQHLSNPKKRNNDVVKSKEKYVAQFEKYCKISTLHGLRYVGDSQFSVGARIFWFIAFSLAIGFATYFISNIYTKWKSSPVIISYNPFDTNINSIPFPAITICNMNQAKRNEAEKILKDGSILEKKLLDDTCDNNSTFNNTEDISWDTLRQFLIRVGNSCSDVVKWCKWGGHRVKCEEYFTNELTDEGLCCSFNRLPPELIFRNWKEINILNETYKNKIYDWNPEKGFPDFGSDYIPRRSLGAGPGMGLSVIVDAQVDNYYCSSTRSTGFKWLDKRYGDFAPGKLTTIDWYAEFKSDRTNTDDAERFAYFESKEKSFYKKASKVMLASPRESPRVADFGFLVGPGFDNNVFIEPLVRIASPTIRSVPIEKRQCYFTNERPLEYYRSYTQRNCLLECQSKYTFRVCKCVPYYLPKNKSIKYCSHRDESCIDNAMVHMETVNENGLGCHCLPACYFVKYSYGKSMSYLYRTAYDDLPNVTGQYFGENMAVMHFFFQSTTFTAELKSELFGFTENLSNTGGLLSLFLGFSFLSLIELLYYITLRVFCDVAKHRRKEAKLIRKKTALKF